ncbi:hypothetical protein VTN00DRAFT_3854 [Thermoascus crustaceus]|uniref:uncharacterized protein n=1 Tax=Thermoascus crustaceus TaxID=5088 RepID=UPI003741F450
MIPGGDTLTPHEIHYYRYDSLKSTHKTQPSDTDDGLDDSRQTPRLPFFASSDIGYDSQDLQQNHKTARQRRKRY